MDAAGASGHAALHSRSSQHDGGRSRLMRAVSGPCNAGVVGPKTSARRLLTGYLCMVLIPVIALLGIMRWGSDLRAPGASTEILNLEPKGSSGPQDLFLVIL